MAAEPSPAKRRAENLGSVSARRLSGWLRDYRPYAGVPDELMMPGGGPRDYWLCFLGDFAEYEEGEFDSRFNLATRHIRGGRHFLYTGDILQLVDQRLDACRLTAVQPNRLL